MQKGLIAVLVVVLVLIGGYYFLNQQKSSQTQPPIEDQQAQEVQTFQGVLPCADCSGLDTILMLNPNNTYTLSEIYQGKNDDEPFVTKGTWENETGTPSNPDQEVLALTASNGNVSYYAWTDENTLTTLDTDKNAIDAPFNLSLTRTTN